MHELFGKSGCKGAVFHYYSSYALHGKFFVVLNDTWPPPDEVITYAYMTSQVQGFTDAKIPEDVIVRLEVGDYAFCTKPTVIDLTGVNQKKADEFSGAPMFKFVCQLSSDDVGRIERAVTVSTRIVRNHKKAILGKKYG